MRTRDILPIADDFDPEDIKGWALGWFFPIAEGLHVAGGDIPDHWEFEPSPMLEDLTLSEFLELRKEWQTQEVVAVLERHFAPERFDRLIYVGNVLARYMDMFVRGTDRDY